MTFPIDMEVYILCSLGLPYNYMNRLQEEGTNEYTNDEMNI